MPQRRYRARCAKEHRGAERSSVRRTSSRCQASKVAGVTRKVAQRSRGSSRASVPEHRATGRGEPRSCHLALEHRELMTQHRDPDILLIWARTDANESKPLANEQERDWTAHTGDRGPFTTSLVIGRILRLHPTGRHHDTLNEQGSSSGSRSTRKRNGRRNVAVRCDTADSSDALRITRLQQRQECANATPETLPNDCG